MAKNPATMTEAQYIFATNLAKVRVLRTLLRDLSSQDALITEDEIRAASRAVRAWEARMEHAQDSTNRDEIPSFPLAVRGAT